jgi:hypothetical protein
MLLLIYPDRINQKNRYFLQNPEQNYFYAGLVLIATVCYGLNINIIKKHLINGSWSGMKSAE